MPEARLKKTLPFWCWSLFAGGLLGLSVPGSDLPLLGLLALFPLLLALEQIQHSTRPTHFKIMQSFFACYLCASLSTTIGTAWITNSAYVFGHLPWSVSLLITGAGYGLEVALMLFIFFAFPLFWISSEGWQDLPARLFFALALEAVYPRFIQWNLGGLTFNHIPWISQLADVIGSSGLGFYSIAFSMFLLLLWRKNIWKHNISTQICFSFGSLFLILLGLGFAYGAWRSQDLASQNLGTESLSTEPSTQKSIEVVALQPNFSLKHLASNPKLAYSDRSRNLQTLLNDSKLALASQSDSVATQQKNDIPRLLVWPESTYPTPYFKDTVSQRRLAQFAKTQGTGVLLSSMDWEEFSSPQPGMRRRFKFYGVSALLGTEGELVGRYNKIFLIPFGEYIPGATWFPAFASMLRQNIQNLSEFEAGTEYTVWDWKGIKIAAPICFDIFLPEITRNMVRNGADLIINLSNLAWFGKTNASDSMEMIARWRAIENRVPILFVSNNGKSVYISENGENLSPQLGLFEEGFLSQTIQLRKHSSFYRKYAEWVHLAWALLFLLMLGLEHRSRK